MWPFNKHDADSVRNQIQGIKSVKVCGMKFKIRKINPLMDFSSENIPQIFTDYMSRRPIDPKRTITLQELNKLHNDMKGVLLAGIVNPKVYADDKNKEGLLVVDDLFRDPQLGSKLYFEIMSHSLNMFRGIKGIFFSIKTRFWLWMRWRKGMAEDPQILSSMTEKPV